MGLQNHPSDVSSESFLLFMAVLVAGTVTSLHSLILTTLRYLGISPPDRPHPSGGSTCGLARLIVLRDQLNRNQSDVINNGGLDADCVVCLNRLGEGDRLRRLACRHVFHKDCLDGWLDYFNFNCPLCRAPLEADADERATTLST